MAVGPLVGGALTDALGWESVFYLNVPIGLAAIAVSYLKLRESRDPGATRVDWPGVATFSGALLFMLVLALLRGNDEGWGSTWIVSLLVGAAVLLVAFVLIERRQGADASPRPVQAAGLHGRADRGLRGLGFDVRAVPLPHALPPELPRLSPLEAGVRCRSLSRASSWRRLRGRCCPACPPARC